MSRFVFWDRMEPATKHLLLITTLCFAVQVLCEHSGVRLDDVLGLHYWQASKFNVMQTVSYMFMHGNFSHLFFNMFALWMFGTTVEQRLGTRKFVIFYLVCGIGAAIIQELTWSINVNKLLGSLAAADANVLEIQALKHSVLNQMVTIGASGAVFGLLLAYGWLFPEARVMFIFFPVPIPSRVFVAIYAVVELLAGVANFQFDNVAHYAHLGGMICGALILYYWKIRKEL